VTKSAVYRSILEVGVPSRRALIEPLQAAILSSGGLTGSSLLEFSGARNRTVGAVQLFELLNRHARIGR